MNRNGRPRQLLDPGYVENSAGPEYRGGLWGNPERMQASLDEMARLRTFPVLGQPATGTP